MKSISLDGILHTDKATSDIAEISLLSGWERSGNTLQSKGRAELFLKNMTEGPLEIRLVITCVPKDETCELNIHLQPNTLLYSDFLTSANKKSVIELPLFKIPSRNWILSLNTAAEAFEVESISFSAKIIEWDDYCLELPFDQYQRYRLIGEVVGKFFEEKGGEISVLDVGGAPGLLQYFLPDTRCYVVDSLYCNSNKFVMGSGLNLPFKKESFDVVVCSDTLEHVPENHRLSFLKEFTSLKPELFIIGAPFYSRQIQSLEEIIYKTLKAKYNYIHTFLKEHCENILPTHQFIEDFLSSSNMSFVTIPNGELNRWLILISINLFLGNSRNNYEVLKHINKHYNSNYYRIDNTAPSYRHVYCFSSKESNQEKIERLRHFSINNEKVDTLANEQFLISLLNLVVSCAKTEEFEKVISQKDHWLTRLEVQNDSLRKHLDSNAKHMRKQEGHMKKQDEHIHTMMRDMQAKDFHIQTMMKDMRDKQETIEHLGKAVQDYKRFWVFGRIIGKLFRNDK